MLDTLAKIAGKALDSGDEDAMSKVTAGQALLQAMTQPRANVTAWKKWVPRGANWTDSAALAAAMLRGLDDANKTQWLPKPWLHNVLPTMPYVYVPLYQKSPGTVQNGAAITTLPGAPILGNITNHGGPVMTAASILVHVILYGNFTANQVSILNDFLDGLGSSSWWAITKKAYGTGKPVRGTTIKLAATSKALSHDAVKNLVVSSLTANRLGTPDANAIYLVLSDKTVSQCATLTNGKCASSNAQFCADFCGWHTATNVVTRTSTGVKTVTIKYTWVGDPSSMCVEGCTFVGQNGMSIVQASPNNDVGMDGVVCTLAHELTETATDPLEDGWYDAQGNENGDKCSTTVQTVYTGTPFNPKGLWSNVIGTRRYLIQNNWAPTPKQQCYQTQ